jgi:predicted O-methyltransferase YrrM
MQAAILSAWDKTQERLALAACRPASADYRMLRTISPAEVLAALEGGRHADEWAGEWEDAKARLDDWMAQKPGAPAARGGVNPGDCRALYTLVRALRPVSVLEVGTHLGSSTVHIAAAMARNLAEGVAPERLVSVDIKDVNDAADAPWAVAGAVRSPRELAAAAGAADWTRFKVAPSVEFLADTEDTFDFVFLDGCHKASTVFQEIQGLQSRLRPGGFVLMHDYFADGRSLWPPKPPIEGPWLAVRRLQREAAPLEAISLSPLPWPTKEQSHNTSLAVLSRREASADAR